MSCIPYLKGDSLIHRLDPGIRIVASLLFALIIAFFTDTIALCAAVVTGMILLGLSLIKPSFYIRRLLSLNLFLLALFVVLPISTPGETAFSLGTLNWSLPGFALAMRITLRANAIVIFYTALISTMSPVVLGHAMNRLKLPGMLVHLLLFTIRYVNVLREEFNKLRNAMKMRGFRPAFNSHTFQSYGYLVGMLMVKSYERSERIFSAMKCRGFHGEFYLLDDYHVSGIDFIFAGIITSSFIFLGALQWLI